MTINVQAGVIRGASSGPFGNLSFSVGPTQADRRFELNLARIKAGLQPNRTPSAAHLAHLAANRGRGAGLAGQATGSVRPSSSGLIASNQGTSGRAGGGTAAPIQGLGVPGLPVQLVENAPPQESVNQRLLNQSDLAAFLRRRNG